MVSYIIHLFRPGRGPYERSKLKCPVAFVIFLEFYFFNKKITAADIINQFSMRKRNKRFCALIEKSFTYYCTSDQLFLNNINSCEELYYSYNKSSKGNL